MKLRKIFSRLEWCFSTNSVTRPSILSSPSAMMATRSQTVSTSPSSWEEKKTVLPSFLRRWMISRTFIRPSGSGPLGRMKVREIIQRLKNEGKTVFFSSHELGEVETVCDRVAIIAEGELKIEGRVTELVEKHHSNLEKIFLNFIGYQPQEDTCLTE